MQIVIDIPEKLACEGFERSFTEEEKNILIKAIGNGTSLPKGHGRLIDANAYDNSLKLAIPNPINNEELNGFMKGLCKAKLELIDAPTIIEADKAEGSEA